MRTFLTRHSDQQKGQAVEVFVDRPLRVVSYNIHKGFGPGNISFTLLRIAAAIRTLDPDLIFLQEVVGHHQLHAARHADGATGSGSARKGPGKRS